MKMIVISFNSEAATGGVLEKKAALRNFTEFTGNHLCHSLFFNKVTDIIKKETLAQVFSCEFFQMEKYIF